MKPAIRLDAGRECIVRILPADLAALGRLLRKRYPAHEWGTLLCCGVRRTSWGLAASVTDLMAPQPGEMDRSSPIFVARSHYLGRVKAAADRDGLSVVVVHSHPQGAGTWPSALDDEMDTYCASLFGGRPYLSLIFSWERDGQMSFSGRAYDRGRWMPVITLISPGETLGRWASQIHPRPSFAEVRGAEGERRNERLHGLVGTESAGRVGVARLGIIGCSGTGSPAAEMAFRAGFKHVVAVDPERESFSNLERMHGSKSEDFEEEKLPPYKVESMRRLAREIDPTIEVVPIVGNILDDLTLDHLLACDAVLNMTDTQHSRAFLSHLATHYLVPCLDVGIAMEGEDGRVTLQNIEITRFWPGDPCAFCRRKIVPNHLSWELMTEEERTMREQAAKAAAAAGGKPDMYWGGRPPQLHTVGYLTTMAGSMAFGYILGAVTGTFALPHPRFQFDPSAERFGFAPFGEEQRVPGCQCGLHIGWADATKHLRCVARPQHWPSARILPA